MPRSRITPEQAAQAVLDVLRHRTDSRSVAPEDIARRLALANGDQRWQAYLPAVRQAAAALARAGDVVILRKGKPVDPDRPKGVYRIAARTGA